jgi:Rrf2 family transcriptional regulator, iron-sulfur cluster assembly transcription factor
MFSKTCKYGLRAVLYLATHTHENRKIGVKEIAEELGVPGPFLAKLLQQLARAQIVSSTKGPNGGFYMDAHNMASNLRQVVESIDGPDVFSSCIMGLPACSSVNPCPLHEKAVIYRHSLLDLVERQSVGEVAHRITESGLSL